MTTPRNGRPLGRRPLPVEVKRKRGNPGHRPLPPPIAAAAVPMSTVPEPPRPLGAHGRELWDRVWRSASWLIDADVWIVLMLCESTDERSIVRRAALTAPTEASGSIRRQLRALDSQIATLIGMCGFTPADRSRLGVAASSPEPDVLATLRALRPVLDDEPPGSAS